MALLHAYLLYGKFLSAVMLPGHTGTGSGTVTGAKLCPQSDVLYPESTTHAQLWKGLGRDFDDYAFMTRAVAWLGGAVRIPYVIFIECLVLCGISFSETPIIMLNEVWSHTILWAPSVRTSGGRLSGLSMTISNERFL
jgi:hypothetical protein